MGQKQTFIKDCAVVLGLSSRYGSTFLFQVLWGGGGDPADSTPTLGHPRPATHGQGLTTLRQKGCGVERRAEVLFLLPTGIPAGAGSNSLWAMVTGHLPLSPFPFCGQVLVPEHHPLKAAHIPLSSSLKFLHYNPLS